MTSLALVAQGASMLGSFLGSSGPSSAQLMMQMINQLNEINSNLVRQNELLGTVAAKVDEIPEKMALLEAKRMTTVVEKSLQLTLDEFQPDGFPPTEPLKHYQSLADLYDESKAALLGVQSVLIHTSKIEHSAAELSYPIIALSEAVLTMARMLTFPSLLVQFMKEKHGDAALDFNPEPHVSPESYQTIVEYVRDIYASIIDQHGPSYLNRTAQRAVSYADTGGAIPGKLRFSGSGYRQERFKTELRKKTWVTHRTKFYREIELSSSLGPASEGKWNDPFEFGITIDGDTARRTWRAPFDELQHKFKFSFGDHMNERSFAKKKEIRDYYRKHKSTIKNSPRAKQYWEQFGFSARIAVSSGYSSGFPRIPFDADAAMTHLFMLEDKYRSHQSSDLITLNRDSGMDAAYQNASDNVAVFIYMSGVLDFLSRRADQLNEAIGQWES